MGEISGLQVFKYLPAAKKLPEGNCKKCGFPTCMAFALKLAKNQTEIELCPYVSNDLKEMFNISMKKPQKEVLLGHKNKVLIGGENVLFRHDKTFVNKTAIAIVLDTDEKSWQGKLQLILDFEITRVNETFKIDLIYLKGGVKTGNKKQETGNRDVECENSSHLSPLTSHQADAVAILDDLGFPWIVEEDLKEITQLEDKGVLKTIEKLTFIRKKAVLEKDENYSNPVMIYFPSPLAGEGRISERGTSFRNSGEGSSHLLELMSKASFYLCKYANILVFEDFDEALISTLMTLRQNIYTDPQKPLQVESKVYEFNSPDENSLVFLTTNFALTYFAVANEIEALNKPAYLVVTPSEGMSVLTAWSAEKFTAQIVAKTIKNAGLSEKIKNKRMIIPGLLSHMKEEIEEVLPEFEILTGPNEAYLLADFVKGLT